MTLPDEAYWPTQADCDPDERTDPCGHVHRESTDPRRSGFCACGQPMPEIREPRDRGFEREAIAHASEQANIQYGTYGSAWDKQLAARLDRGEKKFGIRFLTYDAGKETMEEALDVGAYPLLEMERLRFQNQFDDDEAAYWLYELLKASKWAYFCAMKYRGSNHDG